MNSSIEILVEQRLAELQDKSIDDLLKLPRCVKETSSVGKNEIELFTIHEVSDAGRQRVIVQAIRQRWGGLTEKVVARGFEITDDKTFRMLAPEELYDFT